MRKICTAQIEIWVDSNRFSQKWVSPLKHSSNYLFINRKLESRTLASELSEPLTVPDLNFCDLRRFDTCFRLPRWEDSFIPEYTFVMKFRWIIRFKTNRLRRSLCPVIEWNCSTRARKFSVRTRSDSIEKRSNALELGRDLDHQWFTAGDSPGSRWNLRTTSIWFDCSHTAWHLFVPFFCLEFNLIFLLLVNYLIRPRSFRTLMTFS